MHSIRYDFFGSLGLIYPSLLLKGFGWANTYHLIDPTTGVAAVFDTQVPPALDSVVADYFARFEVELYKGLRLVTSRF